MGAKESQFPGLTYEQGVKETLTWLTSHLGENPLAQGPGATGITPGGKNGQ